MIEISTVDVGTFKNAILAVTLQICLKLTKK
jgi:hypothetical protein